MQTISLIESELKEFELTGKQPSQLPKGIVMQLGSARGNMEAAYKVAIREYVKSEQDEYAASIEKQLEIFKEGTAINLLKGDRLDQFVTDGAIGSHWSIQDGVVRFDGRGKEIFNLATKRTFKNFTLSLEWRITPKGDSGILLRGIPQVQIWDHTQGKGLKIGSGGLYNNVKYPKDPISIEDNPVGQWNRMVVTMIKDRVTVTLNGRIVTNDVRMENYPDHRQPIPIEGPIVLQAFDSVVDFRKLYVHELP